MFAQRSRLSRWSSQVAALLVAAVVPLASGADWVGFLRQTATEPAADAKAPDSWSSTNHLAWKAALPGRGTSSPIVVGDRVLLTCYSGYGLKEDEPGDQADLTLHLVALNRADGKPLWEQKTKARLPEQSYQGFVTLHGYASTTPASDGESVFVSFGRSGVYCYSLDGNLRWMAKIGDGIDKWGTAASPVIAGNLLIINASVESQAIIALDKSSGNEVWRVGGINRSWSTPVVADAPGGRQELVVSAEGLVLGLDPATGARLWTCDGIADYVVPSVIARDGVAYVTAGRSGRTLAVRLGGRGNVTATHRLWTLDKTPKVATPLLVDGHLYWLGHQGVATCIEAATGKVVYEERVDIAGRGDKVYASLILAGGKLYGVTRSDGAVVFAPGPAFKEIGRNRLDDPGTFQATPVFDRGQILLRSDESLYCVGQPSAGG